MMIFLHLLKSLDLSVSVFSSFFAMYVCKYSVYESHFVLFFLFWIFRRKLEQLIQRSQRSVKLVL